MQQGRRLTDIARLRRRRHQRVHQARLLVHAYVRLQPEIPLVALLRLMHFPIARMRLVLRRTRCGDQGGIDQRAFAHQQSALDEHRVDLDQQRLGQVVGFQQMAKSHQRGGIGHALLAQVNVHKVAQCLRVVDRVFDRFIGQSVPLLYEVHA